MNAIRVRRRLDSHVIDLPEVESMVGKVVEIIVLEEQEPAGGRPRDRSALDAIAGRDVVDGDAVDALRRVSRV